MPYWDFYEKHLKVGGYGGFLCLPSSLQFGALYMKSYVYTGIV